jgi:hypothetical protein
MGKFPAHVHLRPLGKRSSLRERRRHVHRRSDGYLLSPLIVFCVASSVIEYAEMGIFAVVLEPYDMFCSRFVCWVLLDAILSLALESPHML